MIQSKLFMHTNNHEISNVFNSQQFSFIRFYARSNFKPFVRIKRNQRRRPFVVTLKNTKVLVSEKDKKLICKDFLLVKFLIPFQFSFQQSFSLVFCYIRLCRKKSLKYEMLVYNFRF